MAGSSTTSFEVGVCVCASVAADLPRQSDRRLWLPILRKMTQCKKGGAGEGAGGGDGGGGRNQGMGETEGGEGEDGANCW